MKQIIERFIAAFLLILLLAAPALAQWQVPNHAVPIGKGTGTGFHSASVGTAGRILIDQGAGADPAFQVMSGSCTITLAGVITCAGGSGTVTHTAGALTANAVVLGNGAADITVLGSLGTTTTVLHGNAAGAPTFGAVAVGSDVSGLGTGIATALGVNVGTAGAPVINGGALGTPSSGTLTNATGLPIGGITGLGTGIATWLGAPASSPITASSINKMAITTPATGSTLAVADNKTFTASNTLTLTGTDGTSWAYPTTSSNVLTTGNTATITKGYTVTANNLGNITNFTVDPTLGNYQFGTNHAAATWTAPASDCAVTILVTNDASAGAITFSGFTVSANTGDPLTTTNTSKFLISMVRINAVATYTVKALQ